MKLKLDECVNRDSGPRLRALGYDVDDVHDEQVNGKIDPAVWEAAQREQRFLITADQDLVDIYRETAGPTYGLFRLRLRELNQRHMADYLAYWFHDPERVQTWTNCLVVATETRIRVISR